MRIGIIAALPGELKQLVNTGFRRVPTGSKTTLKWVCPMAGDEWIAVCAGMGAEAARRAFAEAEVSGPLDRVLSVGWAGALSDEVSAGNTFVASCVVDAQTGERFELARGERQMVLVSTAHVAQEAEKRRLAATYAGSMVDMESATIVRLAQMREIPVCCVKAISDEVGDELPDFNRFIDSLGHLQMSRFLPYVLARPRYWRSLARLGKTSAAAAHSLASTVFTILTGPKNFDEINLTGDADW